MNYIRVEDVDIAKSKVKHAHSFNNNYDMYYVILAMKDGTTKEIRTFCEKRTVPDLPEAMRIYGKENMQNKLREFFIYRLLGEDSLLIKEGRDDYIYLGTDFYKNGYTANRNVIMQNGKTGQQNFDSNVSILQQEVEQYEKAGEQKISYIKREDVDIAKSKVTEGNLPDIGYDMYIVRLAMKDGTTKEIRTFCEKGTVPNLAEAVHTYGKENMQDKLREFFIYRLLGEDSLLIKEGRDDYIYLGTDFYKNGYTANRNVIMPNGKTGQQNFDSNLFNLKLKVNKEQHKGQYDQRQESGKNYVMSDIHGYYDLYMEAMSRLTAKDHVYIIGDVIDRGTNGIKIIQDIMNRQSNPAGNPEVTFILGNHEYQFLTNIETISNSKNNLTLDDIFYSIGDSSFSIADKEKLKAGGFSETEIINLHRWLVNNDGDVTLYDFANLPTKEERKAIYNFLVNSYVVLPKIINDKDYLFVHAAPPNDLDMIEKMKKSGKGLKYLELSSEYIKFMLESRMKSIAVTDKKEKRKNQQYNTELEKAYKQAKANGFTTICGHTPTKSREVEKNEDEGYIRTDVGCGHSSKLALYCIDDDRVEYITEKEIAEKKSPSL